MCYLSCSFHNFDLFKTASPYQTCPHLPKWFAIRIVAYLPTLCRFFIGANTTMGYKQLDFFSSQSVSEIDKRLKVGVGQFCSLFYRTWTQAYSTFSSSMTYISCVWLWFSHFPQWEREISSPPPLPSCCHKREKNRWSQELWIQFLLSLFFFFFPLLTLGDQIDRQSSSWEKKIRWLEYSQRQSL